MASGVREKRRFTLAGFGPAAFFDHLPKLIEDCVAIEQLASLSLGSASFQFCLEPLQRLVPFPFLAFEKA